MSGVTVLGIDNGRIPAVLIHGAMATGVAEWWTVAQVLAKERLTVLVDCPGHGDAETADGAASFEESARYLASLIAQLPWPRVHLVGHSNGANIALEVAVRFPERVASAVLQGGNATTPPTLHSLLEEARGLGASRPDLASRWAHLHRGDWSRLHHRVIEAGQHGVGLSQPDLAPCQIPVLVIEGLGDELNRSEGFGEQLAEWLPNATLWAPDTGHPVHWEAPGDWLARVGAFVAESEGEASSASTSPPSLVSASVTDIRSEPSAQSERLSQAVLGEELIRGETRDGWTAVRRPTDGYRGWVRAGHITEPGHSVEPDTVVVAPVAEFTAAMGGPVWGRLPLGARLTKVAGPGNGTVVARHPDGSMMVVDPGSVRSVGSPLSVEEACELFASLVGIPYLWGGSTPFGYDCSGLTQALFRLCGIVLPRDSRHQFAATAPIEEPGRGDLAFFGESGRISHVGVMLGPDQMVHAWGATGMVSVTRLQNPEADRLMSLFVGFGRVRPIP